MTPATDPTHGGETPSPWVRRFAGIVRSGGSVLDVACGTGRHLRLFLALGHPVVGLDRYNAGIVDLLGHPDFEFMEADLEGDGPWPLENRRFAGIVVTNYLHRPLIPTLIDAIEPGGCLIYETFAVGNEIYGRPSNPDFLLAPGELLKAAEDRLEVVAYEHGMVRTPRPAVIQRICAVKADEKAYSAARGLGGDE